MVLFLPVNADIRKIKRALVFTYPSHQHKQLKKRLILELIITPKKKKNVILIKMIKYSSYVEFTKEPLQ